MRDAIYVGTFWGAPVACVWYGGDVWALLPDGRQVKAYTMCLLLRIIGEVRE